MDFSFVFDLFVFFAGVVWLAKKGTEWDRDHGPIGFVLTTVFSCIVIYVFTCLSLEVGILQSCYY